ncbi:hypothetical protein A3F00_03010 [Candidatus Daviesbacteria bacterium RIFCSPHIGHO2_12_FULL_37_11]|uniref:O-antigen ligase-related domain-containing protein n=1 Tax=Candidatus Daviesbacteria bacterium RIFCSPHIGHO2_12_FULL_37_11 TaxID=1797777 RepID=A0A1F5KBK1_9BACT|nr:MAG: hypothetical protein A3F00_03010 [Candidatus Daviesbacteria bacterium RIFCSPHIGHO2_12_FULL_37_11]OGE46226.1 MAG: hypothetical protein A3B39_02775 [Candidatus Daviesbacteria bacterium RIFCSPLOWO2_01_FULL_37_10]
MGKSSSAFEKYLFFGVLGLFVFIPLYPKFPLFSVPGTYVAVRLEDFLIGLVIVWFFIAKLSEVKKIINEPVTKSILLYWGVGALSLFSAITITHTVSPHLGLLHFLRRIEFMALFFVAYSAFTSYWQFKLWFKVMLFVTLAVALYGFGQQWLNFPVVSTTNKEFSKGLLLFLTPDARVNSTFAGHYDLAVYLMFFIVLAASFFVYYKKIINKVLLAGISGLSFLLLAMTAARVSFFALICGILILFWMVKQKKLIIVMIFLSLFALAISPELRHRTVATLTVNLIGGGGPKYTPPPQSDNPTKHFSIENAASGVATPAGVPVDVAPGEPLNTTELGVFRSFGIRFDVEWPRAIRAFLKNPFLGTGYSSITIATDNDYLRMLGETGILGFASLLLVFFIIVKKIWKFLRFTEKNQSYYFVAGIFCSVIALALNAIFIDVLESSKVAELLWLTLGATFALIKLERK